MILDENYLYTVDAKGELKVWKADTLALVKSIQASRYPLRSVTLTMDYIVTLSQDNKIEVWKNYE